MPMETGRNLDHTTERHQRGFKVPMGNGVYVRKIDEINQASSHLLLLKLTRGKNIKTLPLLNSFQINKTLILTEIGNF